MIIAGLFKAFFLVAGFSEICEFMSLSSPRVTSSVDETAIAGLIESFPLDILLKVFFVTVHVSWVQIVLLFG